MSTKRPAIIIQFPEPSGRPDLPLRLGDTFEARARLTHAGAVLEIGEHRLPARTDVSLTEGDRLLLRVADVGHPLRLQVIKHLGPRPSLEAALREALPRQATTTELTAPLAHLKAIANAWPSSMQEAGQALHDALPRFRELTTSAGLRRALERSGLFLEAHLARGAAPESDLKRRLTTLLRHLPAGSPSDPRRPADPAPSSTPAEDNALRRYAEGLLQRIQAFQARLALHPEPTREWALDLPIREDDGTLHALRLYARPARSADAQADWRVDAHLRLQRLGPIYLTLYLRGGRAELAWWAQQRASAEHIAQLLPALEERLRLIGLEPGSITCYHGWPATDATAAQAAAPTKGIIDERA